MPGLICYMYMETFANRNFERNQIADFALTILRYRLRHKVPYFRNQKSVEDFNAIIDWFTTTPVVFLIAKTLDRRTAFQQLSNRKLQFICSLNAIDTTAIQLQTKLFKRLHADCNRSVIELSGWLQLKCGSSVKSLSHFGKMLPLRR
jgi:hypothetical protein